MFDSPAARGQETCIDRASANPNFPCDLPSWNYSDVLNGLDQFMEMVPNFPIGSNGSGASEAGDQSYVGGHEALGPNATPAGLGKAEKEKRRQYKNKLAQKRFRERQRAHSNDLEAQLKASSAQLEDMKQKQKALEARNIMLEKLIDLDKQGVSAATMSPAAEEQDLGKALGFAVLPGPLAEQVVRVPSLKLTIPAVKQQVIAIRDFAKMSLPAYAELHTAYVRLLGQCIGTVERGEASSAMQQVKQWGRECGLLLVATAFSSPKALGDVYHCKFDEGRVVRTDQPDSFFTSLLAVLNLQEDQVQDVLYLRQLFYGKLGQLSRQRQVLLDQLIECHQAASTPLDKSTGLNRLAEALRKNAAEEYRTVLEFAAAFHCGILTSYQWATALVFSYPWIPTHSTIMEAIAADRGGEPSKESLAADASIDDVQHSANWEDVITYLTAINMDTIHDHVPLLPR